MNSVVMAVCNGQRWLKDQIDSILVQLGPEDELLIALDPSDDDSEAIIKSYLNDSRVRLIHGPGKGTAANFESALYQTLGDIIFLSDQDDVWEPDKMKRVLSCFSSKSVAGVVHDAAVTDENLNVIKPSFLQFHGTAGSFASLLIKNRVMGCCLAFRKDVLKTALPFPEIPMHDWWLALCITKKGRLVYLPEVLLKYRRHDHNQTALSHAPFFQMLKWRWMLIKAAWRLL